MRNPFDQAFFRFLLGFSFILSVTFAMIFFVGKYSPEVRNDAKTITEGK